MDQWKEEHPEEMSPLSEQLIITPRREDVDKFIIRKAGSAAAPGSTCQSNQWRLVREGVAPPTFPIFLLLLGADSSSSFHHDQKERRGVFNSSFEVPNLGTGQN